MSQLSRWVSLRLRSFSFGGRGRDPSYKLRMGVALELSKGCYKNPPFISGISPLDEKRRTRWKNSPTSFRMICDWFSSAPLPGSGQPTQATTTRIPAIAFGVRSTRSASRRADMNRMNFQACCNSASASPTCARSAREWTMRPSTPLSIFRPSAKRCCDIDRRPSPSLARRPRASSMDDRRKRLRWAGNHHSKISQLSSCWPRRPAPQRAIGQCSHGGSWRIRYRVARRMG